MFVMVENLCSSERLKQGTGHAEKKNHTNYTLMAAVSGERISAISGNHLRNQEVFSVYFKFS